MDGGMDLGTVPTPALLIRDLSILVRVQSIVTISWVGQMGWIYKVLASSLAPGRVLD